MLQRGEGAFFQSSDTRKIRGWIPPATQPPLEVESFKQVDEIFWKRGRAGGPILKVDALLPEWLYVESISYEANAASSGPCWY